jgi:hypothetical protein
MEKVINNEIARFLIILGAGVVGLTILMSKLITRVKGTFQPYKKATLLYLLGALLFFGIIAIAAHPAFFSKPFTAFILFQFYFLLLGSAHLYFMHENLRWSGDYKVFYLELLFTVLVSLFGFMAFVFVYHWMNKNGLHYMMAASIFLFIIPFFVYHTFTKAISIPPKILKEWFYPVDKELEEPDDSKLKNLLVISFEFQKHANDPHVTNFRAKAPTDMEFGQLFYYFINDYNDRHSSSKIQFLNGTGEPNGWIFYKKPRWYSVITDYIDADKTIFNNRIRENDVIICTRSLH